MSEISEKEFFNSFVEKKGATWWGDKTPVAEIRLQIRIDKFIEQSMPQQSDRILEIGCGVGNMSVILADKLRECNLVSIDLSDKAVEIAKKINRRNNIEFMSMNCNDLSEFYGEKFDHVIGRSILHHLPDIPKAIQEIGKVIKPLGTIFFCEPNPENPYTFILDKFTFLQKLDGYSPNERPVARKDLFRILQSSGIFQNISIKPYDFIFPAFPLSVGKIIRKCNPLLCSVPLLKRMSGSLLIFAQKTN